MRALFGFCLGKTQAEGFWDPNSKKFGVIAANFEKKSFGRRLAGCRVG
jgi:hypothetical protein